MLKAIRNSDLKKVVGYDIEKDPKEEYQCEYCKQPVIHHKSKAQIRIGHFKHKANPYCPNNISETQDHIRTKKSIYDYLNHKYPNAFKTIELEKWICQNSIRPDVYLETKRGAKIAIEVQASQLTIDQIINRTEKYAKNNIYVLWVQVWKNAKISTCPYIRRECYISFDCDFRCDHSVKLTEMELFLHYLNFKKLIFWDYTNEHSEGGFLIAELDKFQAEGGEFYDEYGNYQSFEGRVAKNKKTITDIHFAIDFKEFKPGTAKSFPVPGKNYALPSRLQMSWKKKRRFI